MQALPCGAIEQKKGRALSSAEVQQGGMKGGICRRLHNFHLGGVFATFKEYNRKKMQTCHANFAWLDTHLQFSQFFHMLAMFNNLALNKVPECRNTA